MKLFERLHPESSLAKGHYTDWVEHPAEYPRTGMGGANVGPELTAVEFEAMTYLAEQKRTLLCRSKNAASSDFIDVLERAVVDSRRWQKWLSPEEVGWISTHCAARADSGFSRRDPGMSGQSRWW
jgi:D-tagatose-1,6-bisphosphate aldolase subunit GatZ/KbaZ